MKCEDKNIVTSLALAKAIACKSDLQELAVLASFFSSLAANLSVIIQCRGLEAALKAKCQEQNAAISDDEQRRLRLRREIDDAIRAQVPSISKLLP